MLLEERIREINIYEHIILNYYFLDLYLNLIIVTFLYLFVSKMIYNWKINTYLYIQDFKL